MNRTDEPRFRLGLARGALAWEQIWPALWPAVGVAGLFIAIALFNVLPSLGGWLHALVLSCSPLLSAPPSGTPYAASVYPMARRRSVGWSVTAA